MYGYLTKYIFLSDELSYKRRIGPSTVLQDKEAIYFANHYASVWARLGYKCAELFQDYLTLCSLGAQVRQKIKRILLSVLYSAIQNISFDLTLISGLRIVSLV